jgi:IMP dehydrogenase
VGCHKLSRAGADIIRINIGSGAQCLTSKSIGIGCPALTSIQSCAGNKSIFPNVKLIADGGIYNPGDALKALCFGADGVMIGSLFGRAKEANNNGVIYGMSSYKLQERMNKTKKSNEGTVTIIPKDEIKPFQEIWNEFIYGLKSGLSYLGCNDINNLHDIDIEYIKINHYRKEYL